MKDLQGSAQATVPATVEESFELLAAIDRYPTWHPDAVKSVEVMQRDPGGSLAKVNVLLHLSQGPLSKDFELVMAVATDLLSTVRLVKVPDHPDDQEAFQVTWRTVAAGPGQTRIALELQASLSVPRFLPVGGVGDSLAGSFVDAATRQLAAAGSGRP